MGVFSGPEIANTGLVMYLDAANTKSYPGSGTAWSDISGKGSNATLANGATYNSNNLGSIVLDGSNDYITWGSANMSNFTSGVTLDCWVYISSSSSSWIRLFDFGAGQATDNLVFCRNSSSTSLDLYIFQGSSAYTLSATNGLVFNTWVNYTATANGANWYIYRNGVQIATMASSVLPLNVTRNSNFIGRSNWPDPYLNGNVSVAAIYNKALTAAEVQQNFTALRSRYGI